MQVKFQTSKGQALSPVKVHPPKLTVQVAAEASLDAEHQREEEA